MDPLDLDQYGKRAPLPECKLTAEQQKQLDTVISWSVYHQPFFAHLLMGTIPIVPTKAVPIAATDSFAIFINPDTFFAFKLSEQAFALYHEVMHCVFADCLLGQKFQAAGEVPCSPSVKLPYEADVANYAMDYVINALLIEAKTGTFNQGWLFDAKLSAKGDNAWVTIYEELHKRKKKGQPMHQPGQSRFDKHFAPGAQAAQDPADAVKGHDPAKFQAAVAAAAMSAEMQGKLPGDLKRLVGEILDPKVSWQEHIRASLNRVSGDGGMDWSQPDRRMISRNYIGHDPVFFGRPSGFSCGTIVIGVDTSGSIGDKELAAFFGEMHGILEDMNPAQLVVMDCDAKVHDVYIIEDMAELEQLRHKGVKGGGGTAFEPVFKKVERRGFEPEALVYLTDMQGSFPSQDPGYPVIWAAIHGGHKIKPPFGEVIHVEV